MKTETIEIIKTEGQYEIMIRLNHLGFYCGYVAVPESHPLFECDYRDFDSFDVHGGITFSNYYKENINDMDTDKTKWAFGFDCGHCCDIAPFSQFLRESGATFKDRDYVLKECESLAKQLKEYYYQFKKPKTVKENVDEFESNLLFSVKDVLEDIKASRVGQKGDERTIKLLRLNHDLRKRDCEDYRKELKAKDIRIARLKIELRIERILNKIN